jgi:hypothetical protein
MRWVSYGRSALGNRGLADDLAAPELVAGQVNVDSRYESVPHVPLDALSVEIYVRPEYLAAEQIVNDQRGDVALTATGVLGRPSIIFIGRVQTPGFAYCLLEVRKSEHGKTVTPSASVWQRSGAWRPLVTAARRGQALFGCTMGPCLAQIVARAARAALG